MKSKFAKLRIALLMLAMVLVQTTFAQQKTINGVVTDADSDEPLPGVTVVIEGTTTGTTTNFEGEYSIDVDKGKTLVFSYIGYNTQKINVSDQSTIDVQLSMEVEDIGEVVVIGYGTQKKTDKTGAVSQISAEDLNKGVVSDPIQSMQGKASGVMITRKGGDPNSGFSVRVRGAAGFEAGTDPLYVVDGVPGVDATTIAPEDIESFNVLKDAASTAIYGSRGANGVIIITTKKGKEGKSVVNLSSKVSIETVANKLDLLNAEELRNFSSENGLEMVDNGANTDWQNEIYRTGISQNHNLNFSGGDEYSKFYASVTHSEWEGILKGTAKERTIGKINIEHKAIDKRLTLSGTMGFTFEQNDYENYDGYDKDDVIYQALSRNPTDPVYNEDGSYFTASREFNYENPLSVINKIDNIRDAKRFLGNIKADFEIFKGLNASANLGYIRNDHESSYFRPKGVYQAADDGYASKSYGNTSEKIMELLLSYNNTFNEVHNLNSILGYSWQERIYNGFNAGGGSPNSEYVKYNNLGTLLDITRNGIGSYKGMSRLIGIFGRVQYNYDSKYFFSASLRRDGSTKFGENNKWGWFPTAAIGWTLTQEDFLSDIDWLDNLKVRASYGVSGNQNIGEYNGQLYYVPSGIGVNPETGQNTIIYTAAKNANPDLKWEQTAETNVGIDYAVFDSKLSGSIELYVKNTTDLLGSYTVPVPPYPADRLWANSGRLRNMGVEFNAQYFAVDRNNITWKTNITFSHNQQEVIDLGDFAPADGVRKEGFLSGRGLIGNNNYVSGVIEGEAIGSFYLPTYEGLTFI
ncbi:MAG: SusC/RagA family TonB-linked outer membrane protein [Prolixibacteraceae bacterium]|nr:SusC/RagA family TonB-linked outer membrane protein [Prolixibacteraceae bacterium]